MRLRMKIGARAAIHRNRTFTLPCNSRVKFSRAAIRSIHGQRQKTGVTSARYVVKILSMPCTASTHARRVSQSVDD